ncbi:hypothetical protein SISSUDRAFT_1042362 [Sistotremastrum suecicum HHB10207 ss-3]|uniref:Uncharacterized protein n=1 Tax=Sistotremastrum suecicum HHB10207 ss-3 TaxID=1314776 RepID=A0A166GMM1_9AGAM|nr:hypothetical protein SISSUDRAFT_1042362 [Sistotremastrum suecicum HHB10207 ss-3]
MPRPTLQDANFRPVPRDSPISTFLSRQDTGARIFVTNVDRTSTKQKLKAIGINSAIHTVIIAIAVWRIMSSGGKYLPILLPGGMGLMDKPGAKVSQSMTEFFWTSVNILIDSALAILLSKFTWPYISGMLYTRLLWGFQQPEVVFRVPQDWMRTDWAKLGPVNGRQKRLQHSLSILDKEKEDAQSGDMHALDPWYTDYDTMRAAYEAARSGEIPLGSWELSVWERDPETLEWSVWEVWRGDYRNNR